MASKCINNPQNLSEWWKADNFPAEKWNIPIPNQAIHTWWNLSVLLLRSSGCIENISNQRSTNLQIQWLHFREHSAKSSSKAARNPKNHFTDSHNPQLQREKKELKIQEKRSSRQESNSAEKILKALSCALQKLKNCPRWWPERLVKEHKTTRAKM